MIPKDPEALARWTKRADEIDDGLAQYPPAGALPWMKRFPIPDTDGLSPAEAETVLAKWRAEVNAAMAAAGLPHAESPATPPTAPVPAHDSISTQAPVA